MFGITTLRNALANLAGNLNALAATVNEVNRGLPPRPAATGRPGGSAAAARAGHRTRRRQRPPGRQAGAA